MFLLSFFQVKQINSSLKVILVEMIVYSRIWNKIYFRLLFISGLMSVLFWIIIMEINMLYCTLKIIQSNRSNCNGLFIYVFREGCTLMCFHMSLHLRVLLLNQWMHWTLKEAYHFAERREQQPPNGIARIVWGQNFLVVSVFIYDLHS